jgi:thioredoxin-related protein
LSIGPFGNVASAETINWYTYNEGITLAKTEGKKVLLFFYSEWCPYCKKMLRETFQDSSVVSYVRENFIAIELDFDKDTKIVSRYGVRILPSTFFLIKSGERIGPLLGYIPPDQFLSMLKGV